MVLSDPLELYRFDRDLSSRTGAILVGCDEAGRGPLAGPVVAGAVVLDHAQAITGLNDSKKVPQARRERLYEDITRSALAWSTGMASVEEIERLNILQASLVAMRRALEMVGAAWSLVLVDGNREIPAIRPQMTIVGGDGKSASVAAASIVAKVTRDRIMKELDRSYPGYGFDRHKGYGTSEHRNAIQRLGLCAIHRRSFCGNFVCQTMSPS